MQCSAFRESGVCSNGRKVSRPAIETLVFEGLREELANPEAIAEYVRTYNAERRRLAKEGGDREKHLQRRNGELDREIDRLITNIAKGADFDTYNPKVNELAAERKRVKAELAQIVAASEIVTVHPAAIERYLADIRRLAEVAAEAAELDEPELVATLRQLVQAVIVHAPPGTDELAIEIKASLSELTLPGPLLKRSSGGVTRAIHAFPPPPSELFIVIRRERKAA
jgi:site-specific DNA recombinase